MTNDVIKHYNIFNTKGCHNALFFGYFHNQPIPPGYYDLLNGNDDDENKDPGTPDENVFPDTKWVEDGSVVTNLIYADDNDATMVMIQMMMMLIVTPWPLNPSKTILWTLKEWTRTMKKCTMAAEWK